MFMIFQRFPINITALVPVGILQWNDTPQGRGGRPSGSPQSTSLSPRVPEEILEQLFLSLSFFFLLQSCRFWEERLTQMFIKTDSGAFKIRFQGFSLISQSKARFTMKADNAGLVTLHKNRDYVLSFRSKLHIKLSDQQTMENQIALF